jgi:diguanylate cyclase (GGDEF)-like protein
VQRATTVVTRDELSRLHMLRRVALESVEGLLADCEVWELASGDELLAQGQTNQTMYFVLEGHLGVFVRHEDTEPVATLAPGETVGELSVLDDRPATAWVRALDDVRVLAIGEESFWQLVGASHELSVNLLLLLAQRMRSNLQTMEKDARRRVDLEREAWTDALTGCHNRRWLDARLPRLVERHRRASSPLCVLALDIDYFKRVNDTYGHAAGDAVLASVGRTILTGLRPTDLGARYGGEEFVIALPDTPLDGALVAADRLRMRLGAHPIPLGDGRTLPAVTASIGVAELAPDEESAALVARADAALYRAKANGRNRVEPG